MTAGGTDERSVRVDHAPAELSARLALVAGVVAVGALALSGIAAAAGVVGLLAVAAAVARGSRRTLGLGVGALFVGALLAGIRPAPPGVVLVATTATVLAWDLGENAISLGEQLGRDADTRRAELAHAAGGLVAATLSAGGGYLVFVLAGGGQPVLALFLLLVGAFVLVSVLRS